MMMMTREFNRGFDMADVRDKGQIFRIVNIRRPTNLSRNDVHRGRRVVGLVKPAGGDRLR